MENSINHEVVDVDIEHHRLEAGKRIFQALHTNAAEVRKDYIVDGFKNVEPERWEVFCNENGINEQDINLIRENFKRVDGDTDSKDVFEKSIAIMRGVEVPGSEGNRLAAFDLNIKDLFEDGDETYQNWQKLTGLNNFKVRICVREDYLDENGGDVIQAIKASSTEFEIAMGWDSSMGAEGSMAYHLLNETRDGFSVHFDEPGQNESDFADPGEAIKDSYKSSLTYQLFARHLSLRLLGLTKDQLEGKAIAKIAHSRGAATALFDKDIEDPRVSCTFLAPVLDQDGAKAFGAQKALGMGSELTGKIDQIKPLAEKLTPWFLQHYVGKDQKFLQELFGKVYDRTDKRVLGKYITNLYKTKFPDLKHINFDPQRFAFFVFKGDPFVDADTTISKITANINIPPEGDDEGVVRLREGDHHGFSDDIPDGDPDKDNNSKVRREYVGFVTESVKAIKKKMGVQVKLNTDSVQTAVAV